MQALERCGAHDADIVMMYNEFTACPSCVALYPTNRLADLEAWAGMEAPLAKQAREASASAGPAAADQQQQQQQPGQRPRARRAARGMGADGEASWPCQWNTPGQDPLQLYTRCGRVASAAAPQRATGCAAPPAATGQPRQRCRRPSRCRVSDYLPSRASACATLHGCLMPWAPAAAAAAAGLPRAGGGTTSGTRRTDGTGPNVCRTRCCGPTVASSSCGPRASWPTTGTAATPSTPRARCATCLCGILQLFGHLGGAGAQLPGVSDVSQHKGKRARAYSQVQRRVPNQSVQSV